MLSELTNAEFTFELNGRELKARSLTLYDLSRLEERIKATIKKEFKEEMEFVGEVLSVDERKAKFLETNSLIKSIGVGTETFDKYVQAIDNVSYIVWLAVSKVEEITFDEVCDMVSINEIGKIEGVLTKLLGLPEVEKSEPKKVEAPVVPVE